MSPIPLGILAAAGAGVADSFDLLETTSLTSSATSITFQNIDSYSANYKDLQIRYIAQSSRPGQGADVFKLRFNNDSGNNYTWHRLEGGGTGSSSSSSGVNNDHIRGGVFSVLETSNADNFGAGVIDLLDIFNNNKYKNANILSGFIGSTRSIRLNGGFWNSVAPVTEISLNIFGSSLSAKTTVSLYGIRAN